MSDSNNLLLLAVGVLIGLAFTTVLILVQNRPDYPQTSYIPTPLSLYNQRGMHN